MALTDLSPSGTSDAPIAAATSALAGGPSTLAGNAPPQSTATQQAQDALAASNQPAPQAPVYIGPNAAPAPTMFSRLLQGALNGLAGGVQSGMENVSGAGTAGFTPQANGMKYAQQLQAKQDDAAAKQRSDEAAAAQQDYDNRQKQFEAQQRAQLTQAQTASAKLNGIHEAQSIQLADAKQQNDYYNTQNEQLQYALNNGGKEVAHIKVDPASGQTIQDAGAAYLKMNPGLMADPNAHIFYDRDADGETEIHVVNWDKDARVTAEAGNPGLAATGTTYRMPDGSSMSVHDYNTLRTGYATVQANTNVDNQKEKYKSDLEAKRQMDLARFNQGQENYRQSRTLAANSGSLENNPLANETPNANGVRANYLASLPSGAQAQVQAIGEGRMAPPNARTKIGKELADQVATAYPNYDATKQPAYQKMRNDFVSGRTAQGLNALNTAVEHLGVMADNASVRSTLPGLSAIERELGDQQANNFATAQHAANDEVGRAYKQGVLSDSEYKEWKSDINSWTPSGARSKATALVGLLKGKINSFQQQLDNGTPSGVPSGISLMNPAAQRTYARLSGQDGSQSSAPGVIPAGAQPARRNGQVVGYKTQSGQVVLF